MNVPIIKKRSDEKFGRFENSFQFVISLVSGDFPKIWKAQWGREKGHAISILKQIKSHYKSIQSLRALKLMTVWKIPSPIKINLGRLPKCNKKFHLFIFITFYVSSFFFKYDNKIIILPVYLFYIFFSFFPQFSFQHAPRWSFLKMP